MTLILLLERGRVSIAYGWTQSPRAKLVHGTDNKK